MNVNRRIAFAVSANWCSRGIAILLGLVLMPVLFRKLPGEELGVWLMLGQSTAMLGLLDLGFGVTLTRRLAFAHAENSNGPGGEWSPAVGTLATIGRRVYRVLALFAFLIPALGGLFFLRHLELTSVSWTTAWSAWLILCLSQGLLVWAGIYSCLIQSAGYVGWESLLGSFTNVCMLTCQIIAVILGGRLIALAAIAAAAALMQRLILLGFIRRKLPEAFAARGRWDSSVFRSMAPYSLKAWLTMLGFALVGQTDQFYIAHFKGAAEIPAYRAAFIICVNLNMIAVTFAQASSVFVSQLWQSGRLAEVHSVVLRNMRLALLIMACGGGFLLANGRSLFDAWLGPGHFIGYPILTIFCVWQFLEVQAFALSASSRATEDEAFVISTLGGGILKLLLAWLLIHYFGLLGLASASLIAMLCTNYWYAVWRALKRLRISFVTYFRTCLLLVIGFGVLSYLAVSGTWIVTSSTAPLVSLASSAIVVSTLFVIALWFLALEAHQRGRVLLWLRAFSR